MKKFKFKSQDNNLWLLIFTYSFFFLFFLLVGRTIFTGSFAFWYDPARDLISAQSNLHKLSLIGPPSGIPGIFYGPYWIWILSIGLFFSKDPRIVNFIGEAIPYLIIFPFILFKFSSILSKQIVLLLWIIFMLNIGLGYSTNIWNPNLAPLLFLLLTYLIVYSTFSISWTEIGWRYLFIGLTLGLLLNFHLAFATGVLLGTLLYIVIDNIMLTKGHAKKINFFIKTFPLCSFFLSLGLSIAFLPFLIFEYRHAFNQTLAALNALIKGGNVVNLQGLNKYQILFSFLGKAGQLLKIDQTAAVALMIAAVIYFLVAYRLKKIYLNKQEKKLLIFLGCISLSIVGLYLSAKNPIWDYHFIGVEIIFLLFIGIIVNKNFWLQIILGIWTVVLIITTLINTISSIKQNPYSLLTLNTKEYIVKTIANDAGNQPYTVFAYSPSIYTYDYSYLFDWKYHKYIPYDPGIIPGGNKLIYLILSPAKKTLLNDFVYYHSPNKIYDTTSQWLIPDGTIILKRVKH